ncbi:unnamed protein product [Meloidogyne enterolobii]|uniref:Uncharacterized protein n=1 Tax=Meloidogyne enterolobii TaxID=390850 RepID=A0ACB0ZQP5_MELEN
MQWKPDEKVIEGLAAYKGMSSWKLNLILDWILGDKRIPARWQVPLAKSEEQFPVVVFSHGISGTRQLYSINCSSLSSHGYVVAALDHRDGSSCYTYELNKDPFTGELIQKHIEMKKLPHEEQEYESRIAQVEQRTLETINMLKLFKKLNEGLRNSNVEIVCGNEFDWEQFKGRLNLDKAISIGHSFGGASALTSCAVEKGFKCCVVMDAWLYPFDCKYYEEITQPVLMLNASKWQWPMNLKRLLYLQQQNGGEGKSMYTLTDIVHQSFSGFLKLLLGFSLGFLGGKKVRGWLFLGNIRIFKSKNTSFFGPECPERGRFSIPTPRSELIIYTIRFVSPSCVQICKNFKWETKTRRTTGDLSRSPKNRLKRLFFRFGITHSRKNWQIYGFSRSTRPRIFGKYNYSTNYNIY